MVYGPIANFREMLNEKNLSKDVALISVIFTMGGMIFNHWAQHHFSNQTEGVILKFQVNAVNSKKAIPELFSIFNRRKIDWLKFENGRFYLLLDKLPQDIKFDFEPLRWMKSIQRMAEFQITSGKGANEWWVSILFHRDYKTREELFALGTYRLYYLERSKVPKNRGKPEQKENGSACACRYGDRCHILTAGHALDRDRSCCIGNELLSHPVKIKKDLYVSSIKIDAAELELKQNVFSDLISFERGYSSRCEIGDSVFVCGYPIKLGNKPTISSAIISKIDASYGEEKGLLQINGASPNKNMSGGPVLDSEGRLIAIITTRGEKQYRIENILFAEPIDRILNFL
ncbi:serine protease [Fibrobacterota bacterium]